MSWDCNDCYWALWGLGRGKPFERGFAYPHCIGTGIVKREKLNKSDARLSCLFHQVWAFEQREARRLALGGSMQASGRLDPRIARRETRLHAC